MDTLGEHARPNQASSPPSHLIPMTRQPLCMGTTLFDSLVRKAKGPGHSSFVRPDFPLLAHRIESEKASSALLERGAGLVSLSSWFGCWDLSLFFQLDGPLAASLSL